MRDLSDASSTSTSSLLSLNTGATTAVIEVVDWFDINIAKLFHKKANDKVSETVPKVPVLGMGILAAYAGSLFTKKDKVAEITETKNIVQKQSTLAAVKSSDNNRNETVKEKKNEKKVVHSTDSVPKFPKFKLSEQIESAAQVMRKKNK